MILGFCFTTFDKTIPQTYRLRNGFSCKNIVRLLKVDISTMRAWQRE